MDIRFISLKFINKNFIKFKKHLSGKKVTYLFIYKIHQHKIYQFIKFIDIRFIKLKKRPSGKK